MALRKLVAGSISLRSILLQTVYVSNTFSPSLHLARGSAVQLFPHAKITDDILWRINYFGRVHVLCLHFSLKRNFPDAPFREENSRVVGVWEYKGHIIPEWSITLHTHWNWISFIHPKKQSAKEFMYCIFMCKLHMIRGYFRGFKLPPAVPFSVHFQKSFARVLF